VPDRCSDPSGAAGPVGPHQLMLPVDESLCLAAHVVPNPTAATRIIVSHGNGLASMGYRVFWQPLCEQYEVVAVDLRGHGASDAGPSNAHDWQHFTTDMDALFDGLERALGPRHTVGAMHSLGAVASLLQMQRGRARWDALALFDLSAAPPAGHLLSAPHAAEMADRAVRTRQRRARFGDPGELAEQFSRADRVGDWQAPATRDMARAVLRPMPTDWVLSCAPEREAAIYQGNTDMGLWDVLAAPACPTLLVGGDPTRPDALTPSRSCLAAHEATGVPYACVHGTGHFLQLEAPQRCRRILDDFIQASRSTRMGAMASTSRSLGPGCTT
jgi:pimeloyl-ACP methyl ester carboxylesterase